MIPCPIEKFTFAKKNTNKVFVKNGHYEIGRLATNKAIFILINNDPLAVCSDLNSAIVVYSTLNSIIDRNNLSSDHLVAILSRDLYETYFNSYDCLTISIGGSAVMPRNAFQQDNKEDLYKNIYYHEVIRGDRIQRINLWGQEAPDTLQAVELFLTKKQERLRKFLTDYWGEIQLPDSLLQ